MDSLAVEIKNLSIERSDVAVLQDITLTADSGKIVGLLGPSGSGKSTLLRCINRLLEPPPKTVLVGSEDVTQINVLDLRRRVGMVFQNLTILPGSIADNLRYGPSLNGRQLGQSDIVKLLDQASLDPELAGKPADELSGGQAQRVALARTLANRPQVLLLDEPTSALDPSSRRHIEEMVTRAANVDGITVLWVTHDVEQAERVADYLYLLIDGHVEDQGEPDKVLADEGGAVNLMRRFAAGELEESKYA